MKSRTFLNSNFFAQFCAIGQVCQRAGLCFSDTHQQSGYHSGHQENIHHNLLARASVTVSPASLFVGLCVREFGHAPPHTTHAHTRRTRLQSICFHSNNICGLCAHCTLSVQLCYCCCSRGQINSAKLNSRLCFIKIALGTPLRTAYKVVPVTRKATTLYHI